MKNFSWFMLAFVFLLAGCKEDAEIIPTNSEVEKITNLQAVKTVDDITTQFGCTVETLKTGEIIQICKPADWNGELIIYAHGYVSAYEPLALPDEAVGYVPLFISQKYAFATTSYTENGLAIQTGINNILDLRKRFIKEYGEPKQIYLAGGSEGGIVTTLTIERYPELFSGGLSMCGPCGDFQKQINYYADFRVLFDYFFPGVLPGNAVNIPDELIRNWETVYKQAIIQAISANPPKTMQLLNVAQASYDASNPNTMGETVLRVLWYDVFATRDAVEKLKGQPYDNTTRVYTTGNPEEDELLNDQVEHFAADKQALKNIEKYYQTTGDISKPLVIAHTTQDPVIPFWHLPLYQGKIITQGTSALFDGIPVVRYGHCNFTEAEILKGFGLLLQKVKGTEAQAQLLTKIADPSGKIVQSVRVVQ